jgi:hypothetical protein
MGQFSLEKPMPPGSFFIEYQHLGDGLSCEQVAKALLLDDDTIRRWRGAFAEGGRKALMRFDAEAALAP